MSNNSSDFQRSLTFDINANAQFSSRQVNWIMDQQQKMKDVVFGCTLLDSAHFDLMDEKPLQTHYFIRNV